MQPEEAKKAARELSLTYFNEQRYHCAESVFMAVSKTLGYDPAPHIAMLSALGAGIASRQTLCGAVSGGILAVGLALGRTDSSGNRKLPEEVVREFFDHIEKVFGTTSCRELTGVDFNDPDHNEVFRQPGGSRETACCAIVGEASECLIEFIYAHKDKMNRYN